ncbi:EAL domain-containing protein [Alicyclobacillus cellulosilyticus]|nr:EAL domain-containing protein [Alicyclobacillus cellulosilyticus]
MCRRDDNLDTQHAGDRAVGADDQMQAILEEKSLYVVYQPIVCHQTRRVFACEALSRPHWRGESVPPQVWFQWAATSGHMVEADLLAFGLAVQGVAGLPEAQRRLPLFVNVLPSTLTQSAFFHHIERVLAEAALSPQQVVIEIVEWLAYDPPVLRQVIRRLHEYGIRVALDDVGIGGAGLRALVDLEPHFIKVDRSLIQGIAQSDARRKLLHLLVEYAGGGEAVVAEGVESWPDFEAVAEAGVKLSQGFLWSRPKPMKDILTFVERFESDSRNLIQNPADH